MKVSSGGAGFLEMIHKLRFGDTGLVSMRYYVIYVLEYGLNLASEIIFYIEIEGDALQGLYIYYILYVIIFIQYIILYMSYIF